MAALAQTGTAQFRARVDVVQIQVQVTDSQGAFVSGLTVEDFRLRVGGSERPLTAAYAVQLDSEPLQVGAAPRRGVEGVAPPPAAAWRQWILFFDAAFISPRGAVAAQQAARDFVEQQVHPRDLVGVVSFTPVEGTKLVVPLTRDRHQVLAAVEQFGLRSATRKVDPIGFQAQMVFMGRGLPEYSSDNSASADAARTAAAEAAFADARKAQVEAEFADYVATVGSYARGLRYLGQLLQAMRGRKHVVFLSQGFDDQVLTGQGLEELLRDTEAFQRQDFGNTVSPERRFGSAEVREELDEALSELRAADAVIHVMEPSGVGGGAGSMFLETLESPSGATYSRAAGRNSLTVLADETGGSVSWNTNDLGGALSRLEERTRSFYVLAFRTEHSDPDLLELEVEVLRSGAQVASAPTRLAAPPSFTEMNDAQRQAQLAEYVAKAIEEREIPFDVVVQSFPGRNDIARVPMVVEIPWPALEQLARERGDGRVEIDFLGYVLDERETMIDLTNHSVSFDLNAMSRSRTVGLPFRLYGLLWSWPGDHAFRVVMRETKLGTMSAATTPLSVPAYGAANRLVVSGPVGIDADHPGLLFRGFSEERPPEHKTGGPIAFPFRLGEEELTPMARTEAHPGGKVRVFLSVHGAVPHPFSGEQNIGVTARLRSTTNVYDAERVAIVGRSQDPQRSSTALLLDVWLPSGLDPGFYELVVSTFDQVGGAVIAQDMAVWMRPR